MAKSTGPMLLVTAVSFTNQWLGNDDLDLKILVAGGVATAGLALVEKIPGAQPIAVGIAWISFITLMFTRIGGKPSPVDNLSKLTGLG
jgi:hypothetical protein